MKKNTNYQRYEAYISDILRYVDRHIDTEGNLYLGWVSDDEYDEPTVRKLYRIMNRHPRSIAFYDKSVDASVTNVFSRADQAMYECKKEMKAMRG